MPVADSRFKLLITEPPLQLLPSLAVEVGLNSAIFLQQLHYWTQNDKVSGHVDSAGRKWLRNTLQQWHDTNFPFWSIATINRVVIKVEEQGFVELSRKYNTRYTDRGQWARLRYGALATHFADCEMDFADCEMLFAYCKMYNSIETTQRLAGKSVPSTTPISQTEKWEQQPAPKVEQAPGADQPGRDEYPLIYADNPTRQAQWEDTVKALFEVCNLARTVGNIRKVNDLAVTLVEGMYAPGWLRDGFVAWWFANDWRGKKGQAPTLKAMEETIAEAKMFPTGRKAAQQQEPEPAGYAALRAAAEEQA
jgi:hypothetical protein